MSDMAIAITLNEREHIAPAGHPENGARLRPVAAALADRTESGQARVLHVTSHGLDPILKIHPESHLRSLQCERFWYIDGDTYITPTSYAAALAVVDSSLSAVDFVMASPGAQAFVLGRPPGHHALADRAMGFCLLNNVALAAQYALDQYSISRVAIVDFDVHHGNGTQAIFFDRPDILFCSTHRAPFYPGTGFPHERGEGAGIGFTINCPLMAGDGDQQILAALSESIIPAVANFSPELIVVSAGFDAHRLDPLGGLRVTGDGYRQIGAMISTLADNHCQGRVVSILEGGYDPQGNLNAITSYIEGLQ
jgi:acetoin utilization deacetylase AcuC-like enzyme